jgi:glycine/D-amino acid oxidase-like deaminating enzyme
VTTEETRFDVAVIGGGNAALCAALTAREAGASVVVIERAPRAFRGGNSRHTRNLRCMHDAPTSVLTDAYPEDEYFADLLRVTLPSRAPASPGCGATARASSPRCAARCTSAAPTPSSSAAARR